MKRKQNRENGDEKYDENDDDVDVDDHKICIIMMKIMI
jgi:hypothetical protein